jgi:hypothetical protein
MSRSLHAAADLAEPGCLTPNPVFVIGSPRSGTSILAKSLGIHSQFWSADETQLLWDLFQDDRVAAHYRRGDLSWLQRQGVSPREFLAYLGLGLNVLLTERAKGRRWIDDTPIYALIVDRVAALFPGARFLHILRDGRQVVRSMMNYLNIYQGDPATIPWASDFRAACVAWRAHVESALGFEEDEPDRLLTVMYDRMVGDPEGQFQEILRFLDAPLEDGPAECFRSTRINSSFQGKEAPRPASEPWQEWSAEERGIFCEEAGEILVRTGFAETAELELLTAC